MREVRRKLKSKLLIWVLLMTLLPKTGVIPEAAIVSAATYIESLVIDFEEDNGGFVSRGTTEVIITEENAYAGKCISVSGGTENWNGAEKDLSEWISKESQLTVSAYVRNNEEYEITAHMTLQEEKEDGSLEYNWIQGDVVVWPGEWKLLSGTIAVNPETVKPVLYFETKEIGASFSIDEVEITIEMQKEEEKPDPEFDISYTKGTFIDFEDGDPYFESFGDISLDIVEDEGYKKSKGLLVEGRTQSYEGPLKNVTEFMDEERPLAGTTVLATALVKNYSEESRWIAITLRLTKADGTQEFQNLAWSEAEAGSWVQLLCHSPYTIGEDIIEAEIYMEAEGSGSFIVDCVNLIAEAVPHSPEIPDEAQAPFDEIKIDFENEVLWFTNRGDAAGEIVSDSYNGERALAVTSRTQNWHGVEKDLSGAALAGKGLQISFWAKNTFSQTMDIYLTLLETDAKGNITYSRIAGGEAVSGNWIEWNGSINVQPETVGVIIYFESSDPLATFVIDDVTMRTTEWKEESRYVPIAGEKKTSDITEAEVSVAEPATINTAELISVKPFSRLLIDFEDGRPFFANRGEGKGVITNEAHGGNKALFITGRTLNWHGVEQDFTDAGLQGKVLQVSFWTKHEKSEPQEIRLSIMEENEEGEITYNWIAGQNGIAAGEWVKITGEYLVNEKSDKVILYFEATDPNASFFIDDVELKVTDAAKDTESSEVSEEAVWVKNVGNIYIEPDEKINVWKWIVSALIISVVIVSGYVLRKRGMRKRAMSKKNLRRTKLLSLILIVTMSLSIVSTETTVKAAEEVMLPFIDVNQEEKAWFYDAVYYNYCEGLMLGKEGGTLFAPEDTLVRGEVATILYRMAGQPAVSCDNTNAVFPDIEDTWYTDAVIWASENGVINGYHNGNFGPDDPITREQLAVMIHNYTLYKGYVLQEEADLTIYSDGDNISAYAINSMKWVIGAGIITGKDSGTRLDPCGYASRAECAVMIWRLDQMLMERSSMPEAGQRNFMEQYETEGILNSIDELYSDNFHVGVALEPNTITEEAARTLILEQFSSITCENAMKPAALLNHQKTIEKGDEEYPVIEITEADPLLTFAAENALKVRGHNLIWHQQTPRWLFTEHFSTASDAPFVSREVMLKRMENYICQVMTCFNEKYPGTITCWDVVNEAIDANSEEENKMLTEGNYWYQVIGEDYVEKAFTYARKYAEPEQKLFYNDYNCYEKETAICTMIEELQKKNLIDGIGMQSHILLGYPSIQTYENTMRKFGEMGLEVQVTELDIRQTDNSEAGQKKLASRYKDIFKLLKQLDDEGSVNITNVTFWGLDDSRTWLNDGDETHYPLLFDEELNPKPAFFGAILDDSI